MQASAIKIGILVTVLIALAAGCATKEQSPGQQRTAFNHKTHVQGAGLDCATCHETGATSAEAGMPTLDACQTCHADDPAKTSPFISNGKTAWSEYTQIPDEVKFSHQTHAAKGLKCEDCHGNMGESTATGKQLAFTMDTCLACHAKKYAKTDCATCHTKIGKDWKPESHQMNWQRFHGQAARAQLTEPIENRCSLCHTEQTCTTCHKDQMPESHTALWRQREHGIAARVDRSTCETCHQSDACDTCHRETEPSSHRGGWGDPRDNHCLVCHFPLQNEGCFTCHKELTGHLEAPQMPGGTTHATASLAGCRACHEPGLSHPDNGDNCRRRGHQSLSAVFFSWMKKLCDTVWLPPSVLLIFLYSSIGGLG